QVHHVAKNHRWRPTDVARGLVRLAVEQLPVARSHNVAALADEYSHARQLCGQNGAVVDVDLGLFPADVAGRRVEADQFVKVYGERTVGQGGRRGITQLFRLDAADPSAVAFEVVAGGHAVSTPDPDVLAVGKRRGGSEPHNTEVRLEMPVGLDCEMLGV